MYGPRAARSLGMTGRHLTIELDGAALARLDALRGEDSRSRSEAAAP